MIRQFLTLTLAALFSSSIFAAKTGVQLFDMYRTEVVHLMTLEEVRALKADLSEEKRVFNKAFSTVKRNWTKEQTAAHKAGNKDFPKFPTKTFIWAREAKFKTFSTDKAADEWYAKQKGRINADMAAKAEAAMNAIKAAKSGITAGYKDRDDKKARRHADKVEMTEAAKEKIGELIEAEMALLLKYNRPVPKHFIYDPVAGADKNVQKKMDQQDAALKAFQKRKAEAEAAAEAGTPAPETAPAK